MGSPLSLSCREDLICALQIYRHNSYCNRSYIDCKGLAGYLTEDRIDKWLKQVFPQVSNPRLPVKAEIIAGRHRKIFSILLLIGCQNHVDTFVKTHELSDQVLPLDRQKLEGILGEDNARLFYETQWQFLTEPVELHRGPLRQRHHILPFWHRELINEKSGRATLWKVFVPLEFVDDRLREHLPYTETRKSKSGETRSGYYFAVKQFMKDKHWFWEREKEAFEALPKEPGMIKCIASWEEVISREQLSERQLKQLAPAELTSETFTTYNILLEYGVKDLDVYFSQNDPPILPWETAAFWKELYSILVTVKGIHLWQPSGNPYHFQGLHADIKPDNLLWVTDSNHVAKLKLADPGLCTWIIHEGTEAPMSVNGMTQTYSPPECVDYFDERNITQRIDIWSLGCVFSIAASWVIGGPSFVEAFKNLRQRAVQDVGDQRWPSKCDFFHDGKDVLPDVREWHDLLRSQVRQTDELTPKILNIIDNFMLQTPVAKRLTAPDLVREFDEIFQAAAKEPPKIPQRIKDSLLLIDQGAEDRYSSSRTVTRDPTIKESKESIRDKAMRRTAFRAATLESAQVATRIPSQPGPSTYHHAATSSYGPAQLPRLSASSTGLGHLGNISAVLSLPSSEQSIHLRDPQDGSTHATNSQRYSIASQVRSPTSPRPGPIPFPGHSGSVSGEAPLERRTQNLYGAWREMWELKGTSNERKYDAYLEQYLRNRDIKFVVDNSRSMAQFWDQALMLIEVLAWKSRGLDENGIDVSFTIGSKTLQGIKVEERKFRDRIRGKGPSRPISDLMLTPEVRPTSFSGGTDMQACLSDLFGRHSSTLTRTDRAYPPNGAKSLTIIVLTDGIWEQTDPDVIHGQISEFVDYVNSLPAYKFATRPVSIQFIQFGDNKLATVRLEELDNRWPTNDKKKDAVDTESADGNIYKMFLGSFVPYWDKAQNGGSTAVSPSV